MTTATTSSPTQTLPGSWTPTARGCLRSTDFWIWRYHTDVRSSDMRTVLGGPTQTTDCLAPTWQSDVVYAGTRCPPNYTPACEDEAVTCCPDVYEFTCAPPPEPTAHSEMFRCVSRWRTDEGVTALITITDLRDNRIGVVTRELLSHQHLFALAMVYTTPIEQSSSASETAPPQITSSSSSPASGDGDSSIGAGAAAGIGVGATAGVALIALATWVLWRRRRRRKHTQQPSPGYFGPVELSSERQYELPTERQHGELIVDSIEFLLAQDDARKLAEEKITTREDNHGIVDNVQVQKGCEQASVDSRNTTVVFRHF
ncbi:hypothetical protein DL764_010980 [Monosporascus ibericus]|uniref:Uncharacterized protein n=1 Tax=Monosporascus ibericus TaxID=155417 RepID=A0A4Q4SU69_9PEZI|nr:hypothetical protein DL764_010980 [Monosporascus ibericus]